MRIERGFYELDDNLQKQFLGFTVLSDLAAQTRYLTLTQWK